MIDEDKLRKLLTDIVTDLSYTVMPGYHTDQIFASIKDKIEKVDLSEETGTNRPNDGSPSSVVNDVQQHGAEESR